MFSVEELFSKRNVKEALRFLETKPNRLGNDGILLSELENYWFLNRASILSLVQEGAYFPAVVEQVQLLKKSGGKRLISSFSTVDRFILRLLSQKLNRYLDPMFLEHSYAYREGKGVLAAVMQARAYIQEGASYLVEIDLHQYFDTIPLERLYELLTRLFSYQAVLDLLRHYLYCQVSFEGRIVEQTKGLIQGSAISPVLSNLYLLDLDMYMETKGMNWMRFADNIYLFCKRREEAEALYSDVVSMIETQFLLTISQKKSGVFHALQHRMLGYDFIMKEGELHCQKHRYRPVRYYPTWPSESTSVCESAVSYCRKRHTNKERLFSFI